MVYGADAVESRIGRAIGSAPASKESHELSRTLRCVLHRPLDFQPDSGHAQR